MDATVGSRMAKDRVLVLGVTGMLGHEVFSQALRRGLDVYATARRSLDPMVFPVGDFPRERILTLDPMDDDAIAAVLERVRPRAVINCLGVIKQTHGQEEELFAINARFPHRLARACERVGAKLIQMSTDCVFSGKRGEYSENDTPDPVDAYGRSKLEGEVMHPHLTVRTSIIGLERETRRSLLGWFLNLPKGAQANGYTRAIWSGLTTRALAPILLDLAVGEHAAVTGLLHVAGEPIDKYRLLKKAAVAFGRTDITLSPDNTFVCDRSLRAHRMQDLGIIVPSVNEMLRALTHR